MIIIRAPLLAICSADSVRLVVHPLGGKGDIRDIGSGNIGATNVLRSGSKVLALATLIADAVKGGLAVALIWRMGRYRRLCGGLAAFIGHLFPVWLDFKGGKGVAVFIGHSHHVALNRPHVPRRMGACRAGFPHVVTFCHYRFDIDCTVSCLTRRAIPQYSCSWWRCHMGASGKHCAAARQNGTENQQVDTLPNEKQIKWLGIKGLQP